MDLTGLHLLLTYQCIFECDHCFVWGSPWQRGVMTLPKIKDILQQALELGTVDSIYFEGGEPFLYYPVLLAGVREAARLGFRVGVVSNAFWANDVEDALKCLEPLAGLIEKLTVSSDLYHYSEVISRQAENARLAAEQLGIPFGVISIARPQWEAAGEQTGQLPDGESGVMYRGRAARALAPNAPKHPPESFTSCPHEDLREPGRVHVDPLGYLHVCQGIAIGSLFQTPLTRICQEVDPAGHPILAPLLEGGPIELARRYQVPYAEGYADACHLCYETRLALRPRFPDLLAPGQMYGESL